MSKVTAFGSTSAETLAMLLERHPDYRVQRRLRPISRYGGSPSRDGGCVSGCAVRVGTTGSDHLQHALSELSMQCFRADASGRITHAGPAFSWLGDTGEHVPGIGKRTCHDEFAVAGRRICEAEATSLILDADFVVAHDAGFDRPFVEKRLPLAAGRPWICSMRDVDWGAFGFDGTGLRGLLAQMGWFYGTSNADADVSALLRLLDHAPETGPTVLARAIATAASPGWIVEAHHAPLGAGDLLRTRGYRWDATRRRWWTEVPTEAFDEEVEWASLNVYAGRGRPNFRRTDWTCRYAAD
ncbi:DNA polymerase III subunit epsilon [Sphingomonas panni]|uniref:DNA polymerase III subunit epsilon n=1 Tax=Sphingomonas panni TaxID=237612 RepID=UPI001F5BC267|nr:DNA polymerase III subunit epsilon [Sphingomonas panni]